MSKSLESQVWQSDLDPELKPVAAVMADMGNDDGLGIYPSVEYLAWLLSRSERSIQRALKKLVKTGVLDRIANASGGRGFTPRYKLSVKNLPERASWQELRKGDNLSPFPEKGDICDRERVTSATEKGDKLTPDPLVDPSVEPPTHPAGYRAPKKPPEEKTLYPPEKFEVAEWMGVYLAERGVDFSARKREELTTDWRIARNADSRSARTLWNWQHDWLRYMIATWQNQQNNGHKQEWGDSYHSLLVAPEKPVDYFEKIAAQYQRPQ